MRPSPALALLLAGAAPIAAHAQTTPPAKPTPTPTPAPAPSDAQTDDTDEPDIIVTGSRKLPGSVIGDIPPDQTLGPADIRSYGVSSVSDLLTELSPQTTSGRGSGPPVVLLNGRRISGFQEIRDLPTEAIARVEILPEEVALKYGYRADQKVVNFVLRRRFRSLAVEAADRLATEGGRNTPNGVLDVLNINRDSRFSVHTAYTDSTALYESERNIAPVAGSTIDQRPYRTLLPFSRTLNIGAVLARPIGKVSTTANGSIAYTDSTAAQGLQVGGTAYPLRQRNASLTYHLGGTANGDISSSWRWSLTGNYDRIDSETFTDTGVDATGNQLAGNRGKSTSNVGEVDALFTGSVFKLPAGDVATSFRVGGSLSRFDSSSNRFGVAQAASITRNIVNGQANVDFPIASRSKDVLAFLGNLSVSGNIAVDQLSDFGTLKTIGYGANWSPIAAVRILASVSDKDEAPTAQQLGNPVIVTPNVPVFDFLKGTTVNVTQTIGGNRALVADNEHTFKLGLTVKPFTQTDFTLTANYVSVRTRNAIASFPTGTAQVEAAFPGRFSRDGAGNLLAIDTRPVNFFRTERSELRWGINFSKPLKSSLQRRVEAFRAGKGPNPFTNLAGLRSLRDQPSIFGGTVAQGFGGPGGQNRRGGQDGQNGQGAQGGQNGQTGQTGQAVQNTQPNQPPPGGPPPDGGPPPGAGGPGGPGGSRGGGGFGGRGGGFGGRGGGFGGRGGGAGGGRIQFALYHTWHFTDRVQIAAGGPAIDLLNGGAIGSGGQPRHEVEAQAGITNNGLGARLSANFQSGTRVVGGTGANPTTLNFSSLTTANLRLFFDPSQRLDLIAKHKWLIGTRFTLSVDNLFDTRQRVRDANGVTPVSYQPDYLDPLGRTVRVSFRKLFF